MKIWRRYYGNCRLERGEGGGFLVGWCRRHRGGGGGLGFLTPWAVGRSGAVRGGTKEPQFGSNWLREAGICMNNRRTSREAAKFKNIELAAGRIIYGKNYLKYRQQNSRL